MSEPQAPYDFAEILEKEIDRQGLYRVTQMIGDILDGKASHIEANWQDYKMAKAFERVAARFQTLARYLSDFDIFTR